MSMFSQSKYSQSGVKQDKQSRPETVQFMTIKMLNKIQVQQDICTYKDENISLIIILARRKEAKYFDNKYQIDITDDTDQKQLIIHKVSQIDEELYQTISNQEDDDNTIYYFLTLRIRPNKQIVAIDVLNIEKAHNSNQIISFYAFIVEKQLKDELLQKTQKIHKNHFMEEEINNQNHTTESLRDKIYIFIQGELNSGQTQNVTQQSIVNKFTQDYTLDNIKNSLRELEENGQLQKGAGVNTFILAE